MAEHRIAEAERADELVESRLLALDVEQRIVRLVNLGDRVSELSAAPILFAVDASAGALDHAAVALHHRGHLLALVRMDQKNDFVVSHRNSLRFDSLPSGGEARSRLIIGLSEPQGAECYATAARSSSDHSPVDPAPAARSFTGLRPDTGARTRRARRRWRPTRSGSRQRRASESPRDRRRTPASGVGALVLHRR